jgi:hypothetical protein
MRPKTSVNGASLNRSPARRRRTSLVRLAARGAIGAYAAFAGLNAQAAEPASPIAPAFGNTVVTHYPDGSSQKIWLHEDGTWDGLSRKNVKLAGHWSLRGDKVCLKQSTPPTLPISYCTEFPTSPTPGVQWSGRDVVGHPITLSLMRGVPQGYQAQALPPR